MTHRKAYSKTILCELIEISYIILIQMIHMSVQQQQEQKINLEYTIISFLNYFTALLTLNLRHSTYRLTTIMHI